MEEKTGPLTCLFAAGNLLWGADPDAFNYYGIILPLGAWTLTERRAKAPRCSHGAGQLGARRPWHVVPLLGLKEME